jgi:hypothetical protein
MGRSKILHRRIAGLERTMRVHEAKIRDELTKPHPNEEHIEGWKREIEARKATIARLMRRLKREW